MLPKLVIEIQIEAAPALYIRYANSSEEDRLWHWIAANDGLRDLFERTLVLVDEAKASK